MCLAVPGRVVQIDHADPPFTSAVVEFGGVRRIVSLACATSAQEGDYVMVHAGVAIARVDADEAARILATLQELDLDEPVGQRGASVHSNTVER